MHHKVAIIGAGPSGLLLARMLHNRGIDCIILENRNEPFLRRLNRGGFLEHGVTQLLIREKAGSQLIEKSIPLTKIHLNLDGDQITLDLEVQSSERKAVIYNQRNIVADLLDGLITDGQPMIFEAKGQRYEGLDGEQVKIIYTLDGQIHSMTSDYVVGCDGFRGISRRTIPQRLRQEKTQELPYAWLEWVVENVLTVKQLLWAMTKKGFAMQIPGSDGSTSYYLQVKRGTEMDDLPSSEEIWDDIENRLGVSTDRGEMRNRKLDYMRFYQSHSMQFGRLFVAGDAAHMVPRIGSKGMNMAFKDASKLAVAFEYLYLKGDETYLANYSQSCLEENLPTMAFTNQLNQLLHKTEAEGWEQQKKEIHQWLTDDEKQARIQKYLIG